MRIKKMTHADVLEAARRKGVPVGYGEAFAAFYAEELPTLSGSTGNSCSKTNSVKSIGFASRTEHTRRNER